MLGGVSIFEAKFEFREARKKFNRSSIRIRREGKGIGTSGDRLDRDESCRQLGQGFVTRRWQRKKGIVKSPMAFPSRCSPTLE